MQFTQTALDEIGRILAGSLIHGRAAHTRKVLDRFKRLFGHLDDGVGLGTPRPEMGLSDDIPFIPTTPYPFIAVFDSHRMLVLRVVYARSDYQNMVISDWFPV